MFRWNWNKKQQDSSPTAWTPVIPAEELCRVMYPTPCKERWTSNVAGWKTCDNHKKEK